MKDRMKQIREHFGLSMAAFGDRLGVSSGSVSMWENGQRGIAPRVIKSVCNEFNVNETWFRTGEGEPFAPKTREQEIAEMAAEAFRSAGEDDERFRDDCIEVIKEMSAVELRLIQKMAQKLIDKGKK